MDGQWYGSVLFDVIEQYEPCRHELLSLDALIKEAPERAKAVIEATLLHADAIRFYREVASLTNPELEDRQAWQIPLLDEGVESEILFNGLRNVPGEALELLADPDVLAALSQEVRAAADNPRSYWCTVARLIGDLWVIEPPDGGQDSFN